jgi:hypothetical protein
LQIDSQVITVLPELVYTLPPAVVTLDVVIDILIS